ncbi:DsbE family thiol:disulfide interchange protein [Inmirania thermothiophila]|uniref:Cytochrome c biogenesis protein CcmG/thiol:disulfide interchange protein DsbE n=1 Tax=Inmirania thermothiophila TaxID=1750597 RepID=A0A3N1XS53_9GAMM|nr:DsbE family thiol:disulfide interchange protein [Inmirania thermothiophila]ROR29484.1 cytochrome c biogenesis protein CcmG/thiol:disulfide interchange protein DsbE [Inmirania thermothiophila]
MRLRYLLPAAVFAALVALFAVGLGLDPKRVPSPLIDKPAPEFALPSLHDPERIVRRDDLKGRVYLFNVWASWCVSCRAEHPLLVELARRGEVPIYGLNYKDERGAALAWLADLGDPYTDSLMDRDGRVGIDWGVYGVPETFVVDRNGIIRYKQIGPITPEALNETILPLVQRLKREQG